MPIFVLEKLEHVKDNQYRVPRVYRGKTIYSYFYKVSCALCGNDAYSGISNYKKHKNHYCSVTCQYKSCAGSNSYRWTGGRKNKRGKKGGHILAYAPNHPNADRVGYVAEHRLVVERDLGRYLSQDEHVHHIDGDPQNNDLSNLAVVSVHEHRMAHASLLPCVKTLLANGALRFNRTTLKYEVIV